MLIVLLISFLFACKSAQSQFVAVKNAGSSYLCTGVLLDVDFVVTSSKCVLETDAAASSKKVVMNLSLSQGF